jgi:YVTN family beta-propeller protein
MTLPGKNKIAVVDLKTMQVARSVETPPDPEEVLVRPDGKVAYVSCVNSNQVAVIDLATWKVTRRIATGKASDGLAWAVER